MARLRPINIGCLLALVVAGGLTACGETRGTRTTGTTTTAPKQTDYRNVATLEASLKEKLDKGRTATHNGPVKAVSCIATTGKQSELCIVTYRSPPKETYEVVIAQDGRSYTARPFRV
jgi:enterochelin esterase-like enzyme